MITKLLPDHLSVLSPYNPTLLPIRIIIPTSPDGQYVKPEYAYVRSFVQDMYDKYQDEVDAIVHLGMADGWEWYSVEEKAFNEAFTSNWWGPNAEEGYYLIPDAEGKTVRDIDEAGGKGMWDGMPMGFKAAGVNVRIIVDDVKKVVNYDVMDGENEHSDEAGSTGGENGMEWKKKMKVDVLSHDEAGIMAAGSFSMNLWLRAGRGN
jgi:pyroglutamyl-peptidase